MFSCCRCVNTKKDAKKQCADDKKSSDSKNDNDENGVKEQTDITTTIITVNKTQNSNSDDVIEIRLTDDNNSDKNNEKNEDFDSQVKRDTIDNKVLNNESTDDAILCEVVKKERSKSDSSNLTIEETIVVNNVNCEQVDKIDENVGDNGEIGKSAESCVSNNDENGHTNDENDDMLSSDTITTISNRNYNNSLNKENVKNNVPNNNNKNGRSERGEHVENRKNVNANNGNTEVPDPDSFQEELRRKSDDIYTRSSTSGGSADGANYFTYNTTNGGSIGGDAPPKSCMSRRSSSKSSIRKRVNINDSTEVIPSSDFASIDDDDEVFSDSIPPKVPRGDMCAPYVAKRGSIIGNFGLPEWFNEDRFYAEFGGSLEPPVTPVGRDELALKRHRMYSELIMAAQAAVEHRVRFDPLGPDIANVREDCDPDLKPSVTIELENLVNRLEKLVDRLERSVSARELEIANRTFDSVIETTRRRSFDLETTELPPIPKEPISGTLNENKLIERIDKIEASLNSINGNFNVKKPITEEDQDSGKSLSPDSSNIPTVVNELFAVTKLPEKNTPLIEEISTSNNTEKHISNMSVAGYQDIVNGPLAQYINLSNKIGGDVSQHAKLVKFAFDAQLQYVTLATQISQPAQNKQLELLKPTSNQIAAIQDFREKNRVSPFFNHLSAISESIPALGWVCVTPTPGPHVKEMNDAGQFYTNRVLKDWKEKDPTHVEWARAWIQTLSELQQFIKKYHTTGLVWSGKGGAPPPPPPSGGMPPPPPPPIMPLADLNLGACGTERSALFAEINQGEAITKNLKKVTSEMQTHKNPTLRTGPAPFKAPQGFSNVESGRAATAVEKAPVFTRDGKKWLIEYQKSKRDLVVENAEMNNVIYMFRCQDSVVTVKGKINNIFMDSCKKCSVLFDSLVSSIEFVNCQSVQMQVLGKVPTISIDKTDGCQMYLSSESLHVEIISSKSSEMNVLIPKANGDYTEQPIPEQYKTTIHNNSLQTVCVDSLG